MSEPFRRAVYAICDRPEGPADDLAHLTYEHLQSQVEAILAAFEEDGVVFGRFCPRSERGDMAAVVASVLLREAAERHPRRDFQPCARCGQLFPERATGDGETCPSCAGATDARA